MPKQRLEHELTQLAIASPQVIATRLWLLWMAGGSPSAADRREWQRMHQEKVDAAQDGYMAMCNATLQAQSRFMQGMWQACMTPWTLPQRMMQLGSQAQDATAGIVASGLAPARRRAVANAKRLRGARRR